MMSNEWKEEIFIFDKRNVSTRFSPPWKFSMNFQRLKCTEKIHTKKWRKIKIWFDEIKIRLNVKNEKTDILQNFTKNDESTISKKGARTSTVKEIIQEQSESDDGWVWDWFFCFMMSLCLCKFDCLMHYFFFGPNSGITSFWNLL